MIMSKQDWKKIIFSISLIFIFFNLADAQIENVAQIDKYVKKISSLTKKTKQRIFADIASDGKKANWKEFKTEKMREKADTGDNLNENAVVWIKAEKISAATFTFQSPSRDWAQFATYYFRPNGTLAKIESNLNTFYGSVTAKLNYYYDSKGKIIKQTASYFDLQSQKPIDLKKLKKEREFIDEEVTVLKNTSKLPFIKLIN